MHPSTSGPDANAGAATFATTHWSVVLTAQGQSPAADAALEALYSDLLDAALRFHPAGKVIRWKKRRI